MSANDKKDNKSDSDSRPSTSRGRPRSSTISRASRAAASTTRSTYRRSSSAGRKNARTGLRPFSVEMNGAHCRFYNSPGLRFRDSEKSVNVNNNVEPDRSSVDSVDKNNGNSWKPSVTTEMSRMTLRSMTASRRKAPKKAYEVKIITILSDPLSPSTSSLYETEVDMRNEETEMEEDNNDLELPKDLKDRSIDMLKEGEGFETIEALMATTEIMCEHYDAFNLRDVRDVELALMKIISEDRDLNDQEYEVCQRLEYLVDKISSERPGFYALGDGIREDLGEDIIEDRSTDDDNDVIDMLEEGSKDDQVKKD